MPRPTLRLSRLAVERAVSSHDQIAAVLGTEILKGSHHPGKNMPAEIDLTRRFQVSRTVVREVMRTLSAKGLVVSKTRVGTRVRDPAHWNFFDADVLAWHVYGGVDEKLLEGIRQVRRAMEPVAAALAARRRSTADIRRLRELVRQMGRSGHTRQSFAYADLDFHVAVGSASGNPLMHTMASVIEAALLAHSGASAVDDPDDHELNVNSHAAIVDAIEAGDERAAELAMLRAIDIGVRRMTTRQHKAGRLR